MGIFLLFLYILALLLTAKIELQKYNIHSIIGKKEIEQPIYQLWLKMLVTLVVR